VTNPIHQLVDPLEAILGLGETPKEFSEQLADWMEDTKEIDEDFKDGFLGALMGFIMAYKFATFVNGTEIVKETSYKMAHYYGTEAMLNAIKS
jgi:hypothetical protein